MLGRLILIILKASMELSKRNNALLKAQKKGYTIDKFGNLYNPVGKKIIGSINNKYKVATCGLDKFSFHRFQAYQKFGRRIFKPEIVVRHLDGDHLNNSWDNIDVGSHRDNMLDKPAEVRLKAAHIAAQSLKKLKPDQVNELKRLHKSGWSYMSLMSRYKIASKSTIYRVVKNKSYQYE